MIELESIRLEKQLKSAGHSCIYLARDRESGQRRIYREFEGKGDVYQKLAQLHCPHLPQIYQVQEVGDRTAVVEEFITGGGGGRYYLPALRRAHRFAPGRNRPPGYQTGKPDPAGQ